MKDDRKDRTGVSGRDLEAEYKEIIDRLAEAPGVETVFKIYYELLGPFAQGQVYVRASEPEPSFITTDTTS